MTELKQNPKTYGLPEEVTGSVRLASFNIRNLGKKENRTDETWEFLAYVCSHFDFISVQEILADTTGLYNLKKLLGKKYGMVISDVTGQYPKDPGKAERMVFIWNWEKVQRVDVVTDFSIDRRKILDTIAENFLQITEDFIPYIKYLKQTKEWREGGEEGRKPRKKKLKLNVFLDFIRSPYCVSYRIKGKPNTKPYEFMAVNAHLHFGDVMKDRELEFEALMDWIIKRVGQKTTYFPNFILLGDLNLNFDNPDRDRKKVSERMKEFDNDLGQAVHVNFPFIDVHPSQTEVFRTNARRDETFDQIGLFFVDEGFPKVSDNRAMGTNPKGPDYGEVNFVELFSQVLYRKAFNDLTDAEKNNFYPRFEYEVSDHMPIWLRLPLPGHN